MSEKTKKQHYVPQFYLRFFSRDGKRIYMYDKEKNGSLQLVGISGVAQENYFYDLGKPGGRDFKLEESFSKIEAKFALDMVDAIKLLDQGIPPVDYMDSLAMFMVISELRTKAARDRVVNFHLDVLRHTLKLPNMRTSMIDLAKYYFPEITTDEIEKIVNGIDVESVKDAEPLLHAEALLGNKDLLEEMHFWMMNRQWYIFSYENEINYGFWTSDAPLVRYPEKDIPSIYGLGYTSPITDFAFPLSPKYCLILRGEGLLNESTKEASITLATCKKKLVDYVNLLQCMNSFRFIFPCSSNYYLLRHMSKNHPELLNHTSP